MPVVKAPATAAAAEVTSGVKVNVSILLQDPLEALLPVLQKVVGWEEATAKTLKVSQLSGAMTNLIYRCRYQLGDEKRFALARVFGNTPEDLFSRDYEQMIFSTVARAGMGPKLLVSFVNGRIEEFYVSCKCLSAQQLSEPNVSRALAAAMSTFHFTSLLHLPPEEATDPQVWTRLKGWLRFAVELYGEEGLGQYGLTDASAQIEELEANMKASHPSWLAFCHNDLQCGNVMLDANALEHCDFALAAVDEAPEEEIQISLEASMTQHEDDLRDAKGQTLLPRSSSAIWVAAPTTAIKLIDYEYAGMNCVAFDIANHWCEYAADYDTATPHKLDFSKMPSTQRQAQFVEAYVASLSRVHDSLAAKPGNLDIVSAKVIKAQEAAGVRAERPLPEEAARALASGSNATKVLISRLQAAACAYIPVSHVAWGLWGLIQAKSSTIDFDYIGYATQRLAEFQRLMSDAASKTL